MQGQGHFLTLAPGHLHMKIKVIFLWNCWAIFNQILYVSFEVQEKKKKIHKNDAGHMTKMAAMPICGKKKPSEIFSGTGGLLQPPPPPPPHETFYVASGIPAHHS